MRKPAEVKKMARPENLRMRRRGEWRGSGWSGAEGGADWVSRSYGMCKGGSMRDAAPDVEL